MNLGEEAAMRKAQKAQATFDKHYAATAAHIVLAVVHLRLAEQARDIGIAGEFTILEFGARGSKWVVEFKWKGRSAVAQWSAAAPAEVFVGASYAANLRSISVGDDRNSAVDAVLAEMLLEFQEKTSIYAA